jgi:4-amino-4-deoxy-L-arabinose transferase-like glycosyltransferase
VTDERRWHIALLAIGAITLLRVLVLFMTPLQLYPDEAQYWWWAVHPDWGYFSKPPMIAWLIGATMSVCGDGEACIRLSSPLLHGATALVLFGLTRTLYDARTALWTSLVYLTLPGLSYSALLVSTDVPLLFFWSVALLAFVKLIRLETNPQFVMAGQRESARSAAERVPAIHEHSRTSEIMDGRDRSASLRRPGHDGFGDWGWTILCGVAIGLGCLSKYAMLYFVLGAGLVALFSAPARRALLGLRGLAIVAVAAVIFAPNIVWNVQHHFATVQHTAANANWSHPRESFANLGAFVASQFGVMGPLLMAAYLYGAWRAMRGRDEGGRAGRLLLCFSAPILAIVTIQSFISEANANWAAAAYIAATPLAVHTLLAAIGRWSAWATAAINAAALAAIVVFALSPAAIEASGLGNAFKRFHGWRELGLVVVSEARAGSYEAVVVDNRSVTAALLYYARPLAVPILVWDADEHPDNHFQMTMRLESGVKGRVLVVSDAANPEKELSSFASSRLTRSLVVPIGGGKTRTTKFFVAEGYRGPSAPNAPSR